MDLVYDIKYIQKSSFLNVRMSASEERGYKYFGEESKTGEGLAKCLFHHVVISEHHKL